MDNSTEQILPTFVLQAATALAEGDSEKAIEICQKGIDVYPDYPMGFLLLAEAYEKAGDDESVKIILAGAYELFPYNKTVIKVKKKYEISGKLEFIATRQIPIDDNIFNKFKSSISQTGFVKPDLTELPEETEDLTLQNPEVPATETLANILAGQGKIQEAIEMYERLQIANPEKFDYFSQKIDELKAT